MRVGDHNSPLDERRPSDDSLISRTRKPIFYAGLVLVTSSLLFGLTTYLILTGLTPIEPRHGVVVTVLAINSLLILGMTLIIGWHVLELWQNRRTGKAGAKLHVRFVSLFSVVAALPAIILAVFASISLNRGLDHVFSTQIKQLVSDSLAVATAYVKEHGEVMRADMVAVAEALEEDYPKSAGRTERLAKLLQFQSTLHALPNLFLIDGAGKLIAEGGIARTAYQKPQAGSLGAAEDGTVIIIPPAKSNKMGAIKKLATVADVYIYAARPVNPVVIRQYWRASDNVAKYQKLENNRAGVQIAFGLMYVAIALTLLLAAIWLGLWFATRLSEPIRQLIAAAQSVSEGNLDTVVHVRPRHGELAQLGATFNNMTAEIKSQQNELIDANLLLDERRRFIEAVLSGVSAGVIGLDTFGIVDLVNRSAEQLLGRSKDDLLGKRLELAVPEFQPIILRAKDGGDTLLQDEVDMAVEGNEHHFAVKLTRESSEDNEYGFVLTFDDTTELLKAQRSSAWADVARRIAHEMKNPLTPIQLSAERIRRKYGQMVGGDRKVLDDCTSTIISRVSDIKRMVDEFSDFARMPQPVMEPCDLREIVGDVVALYQSPDEATIVSFHAPDAPLVSLCDRGLLSQALINMVKNAGEAIEAVRESTPLLKTYRGRIDIHLNGGIKEYRIEVIDNGCGLPKEQRNRLLEPYVTTREKGTGLGLAIVQKIIEQHGGRIMLEDAPSAAERETGAKVVLILPFRKTIKSKEKSEPSNTGNDTSFQNKMLV